MTPERMDRIARDLMADRKGHLEREAGYIYHHGKRVAGLALCLADRIDDPLDVPPALLRLAGHLHDVGKGIRPHAEVGAAIVRDRLVGELPPGDVETVARLVAMHCRRGEPAGVAERILQDADLLDHFGAQQVWLNFHYSAAHDRSGEDARAYFEGEINAEYAAGCREAINFPAAAAEFDARRAFERAFFRRFARELNGELFAAEEEAAGDAEAEG